MFLNLGDSEQISPNLYVDLRETAREIVAQAPVLSGWEFYSTRQPKEWNYKVELAEHGIQFTWMHLVGHSYYYDILTIGTDEVY